MGGIIPPPLLFLHGMPYTFTPPSYAVSYSDDPRSLWRFVRFARGYSVRVLGAAVDAYPGVPTIENPTDFDTYDYVYEGGRQYTISDDEYATLIAADERWADHAEAL